MASIARGAAAGGLATLAMSVPMVLARRIGLLDRQPPEEITGRLAAAGGMPTSGARLDIAAAAAHLAFGSASGALFAVLRRRMRWIGESDRVGLGYGVAVWALAYRVVLPRVGLIRGTERAGAARDAVMLVAHGVYGLALGRLERMR